MIYNVMAVFRTSHITDDHEMTRMLDGGTEFFDKVWDVPVDLSDLVVTLPSTDSRWFEDGDGVAALKEALVPKLSERIECNSWEFAEHCKYVKNLHDESRRWAFNAQMDMATPQDPFPEAEVLLSTYRASKYDGEVRVAEAVDAFLTDEYSTRIANSIHNQFKDVIKRFHDFRGIARLTLVFGQKRVWMRGGATAILKIEVTE